MPKFNVKSFGTHTLLSWTTICKNG